MTAGPTPEEVTALLQGATQRDGLRATSVDEVDGRPVVVVAGSGKKSLPSFNISTPAALIAATCGANVVKMGSHATSSPTGSRDLAASLSIPESVSASGILEQLRKCSFAFVPIESTVPSLNRVYGRRFHTVTPFSFGLAALACPLRPYATVFGLSHPKVDVATQVLTNFGFSRVHATASVNESTGQWADEFAMGSKTVLATLYEHNTVNTVSHKSANFVPVEPAPPPTGAQSPHRRPTGVFTEIITGQAAESRTNVVTAGTGLILHAAGIEPTIQQGQKRAHKALEEGQPHRLLEQLTGVGHDH
ncbi:hypothetical protein [Haloglycomyces albus]|uniref:hypothetical protein n=1 Tax=Haloglycomyces albus TaxID=526067 RepID=UPI00146FC1A1|nr:hypothetical protein [Haloglycomyces albus]